jgi:hypothetical protein
MTDDPREILKRAGIECPELDMLQTTKEADGILYEDLAEDALLALARLAAKFKLCDEYADRRLAEVKAEAERYKWQRDEAVMHLGDGWEIVTDWGPAVFADDLAKIERRWEERNA